jgi:hypothetical protein
MDEIATAELEMVGLRPEDGDKFPSELSGGMMKRVARKDGWPKLRCWIVDQSLRAREVLELFLAIDDDLAAADPYAMFGQQRQVSG